MFGGIKKIFSTAPIIYGQPDSVIPSTKTEDVKTIAPTGAAMPVAFSLREFRPPILNQHHSNACTGFGAAGMASSLLRRLTGKDITLSPWWVWYNSRKAEGNQNRNVGVMPKTMFELGCKKGFVALNKWNLDNVFTGTYDFHKAVPPYIEESQTVRFSNFYKVDLANVKQSFIHCLGVEKSPIGLTIKMYADSLNQCGRGGSGVYVQRKNDVYVGNHFLYCDGYDVDGVTLVNSFGTRWGKKGVMFVRWDDLKKLIIEAWTFDKKLT